MMAEALVHRELELMAVGKAVTGVRKQLRRARRCSVRIDRRASARALRNIRSGHNLPPRTVGVYESKLIELLLQDRRIGKVRLNLGDQFSPQAPHVHRFYHGVWRSLPLKSVVEVFGIGRSEMWKRGVSKRQFRIKERAHLSCRRKRKRILETEGCERVAHSISRDSRPIWGKEIRDRAERRMPADLQI